MTSIQKTTLPNGVRILTESVDYVGSASIGIWCRTGSIDETTTEGGITHLIEHMLFKGTSKRDAKQIAEAIEGRGGMLNAFTDKEQTCYYCRTLADDACIGLDVLSDMVVDSKIDETELEREKGVVIEEIKRSEDEPGDHVYDVHLEALWAGHKIGLPIIGTRESVSSFSRDDIKGYMGRRYLGGHILVSVAGNVNHDEVVTQVNDSLGSLAQGQIDVANDHPTAIPGNEWVGKDIEQVHFCIGTEGRSLYAEDLFVAKVLDGILGSGMSSRLFQQVRERRGLAYSVGSYHASFSCAGAFTIHGGTGLATWEEVQKVVRAELDDLSHTGPTEEELAKVKRLMSGSLILGLESMSSRMMRMARNEMVHGRSISAEETRARIEEVTTKQVQNLAAEIFAPEKMRTTVIGPMQG